MLGRLLKIKHGSHDTFDFGRGKHSREVAIQDSLKRYSMSKYTIKMRSVKLSDNSFKILFSPIFCLITNTEGNYTLIRSIAVTRGSDLLSNSFMSGQSGHLHPLPGVPKKMH